MDIAQESGDYQSPGDGAKRACDQCRLRKIRCDKDSPCSNCRTAHRQCSSSGLGQRPKEARQRVLISTQYERKIDQFENRLAGIEGMLRELTLSLTNRNPSSYAPSTNNASPAASGQHSTPPTFTGDGTNPREETIVDDEPDSEFVGDSSMAAHSAFASEFLQEAVTRTSFHGYSPDMESALQSLRHIATTQNRDSGHDSRFEHAKPLPKGGFRDLPMPPMQTVVAFLRDIKTRLPPQNFTLAWITTAHPDIFSEQCRMVYFADEDYSLTTFAIVNGGLYYLFQERAWYVEGEEKAELLRYMAMCRDNFETALVNLPLLLPARKESVEVLVMASTYAIEASKFSLAWRFNITAVILCQTLGYHRQQPPEAAAVDSWHDIKPALFWFAYANDKCFSLRFGRSSMIQDHDITIPRKLGDSIVFTHPAWKSVFHQTINHAEFIGKAYEALYSPAALTHTPERRAENAHSLMRMLDDMYRNMRAERDAAGLPRPGTTEAVGAGVSFYSADISIISDEVTFHSAMTLIYRAIPNERGPEGSLYNACIEAARKAIAWHHECMRLADTDHAKAAYLHWTILYLPFVPVIVLFCHVIETSNLEDLQRLSDFADSLQPACSVSPATEKFLRVCRVLYNVARLYTEAKAQQDNDLNLVGNDIDMYLSQLGFIAPQDQAAQQADFSDGVEGFDAYQAMRLGNWFSATSNIMGLVEGNLPELDPRDWPSIEEPQ